MTRKLSNTVFQMLKDLKEVVSSQNDSPTSPTNNEERPLSTFYIPLPPGDEGENLGPEQYMMDSTHHTYEDPPYHNENRNNNHVNCLCASEQENHSVWDQTNSCCDPRIGEVGRSSSDQLQRNESFSKTFARNLKSVGSKGKVC